MSCISINELNIAPELVFSNITCHFKDGKIILGDVGGVVCTGADSFSYRAFNGSPKINLGTGNLIANYYDFEIQDSQQRRAVTDYLRRGYQCLAKVDSKASPRSDENLKNIVSLSLAFFIKGQNMVELSILVSDKVKKKLKDKKILSESDDLNDVLRNNFALSDGLSQRGCFAYFQTAISEEIEAEEVLDKPVDDADEKEVFDDINASAEALDEQKTEGNEEVRDADEDDEDSEDTVEIPSKPKTLEAFSLTDHGFTLYGKSFNLVIAVVNTPEGKSLLAKKYLPRNQQPVKMQLGQGLLSFTDNAEQVNKGIKDLFTLSGEYVKTWEAYTNMEGEFLLKRAREIGVLRMVEGQSFVVNEEGSFRIMLHESARRGLSLLNTNDNLDCFLDLPSYLNDLNLTWEEYKRGLKLADQEIDSAVEAAEAMTGNISKAASINKKPLEIEKIDVNNCSIVLKGSELPKGHIVLSLRGYEMQIKRREVARENIIKGNVPNPRIAEVIANNIDVKAVNHRGIVVDEAAKIPALSSFVKKKIFPNPKQPPTSTQEEAIGIALNTPDIAIIQGPPGTGKTTVITAILERLNELTDKNNIASGKVLITSLQHDAVNNVIERIRINSLPTIKYGRKLNYEDSIEGSVELWCDQLAGSMLDRNPGLKQSGDEQRLAEAFSQYVINPTDEQACQFLKTMKAIVIDNKLLADIDLQLGKLSESSVNRMEYLLPSVRRLRVKGKSFMDDGASVAGDLYDALEGVFNLENSKQKEILEVLKEACLLKDKPQDMVRNYLKADNQRLLKSLERVKYTLMEACVPKPVVKVCEPKEELLELYGKVKRSLKASGETYEGILRDLLNELENNQLEIRNSVANYSYAFAATAQQSEGIDIRTAKGIDRNNKDKHPEYDTVIVDEAARVNPVDLMVPLSQAKERIILVGDHRQLPHMYDQEIFEALTEKGISVQEEDVKLSMFQQLLEKAKALESIDGRKRYITLDKQYRTHPLLGDFVSNEYYKPYGESYASPLGAELFQQEHFPAPLVWIDVPYEAGNEGSSGTSRLRCREAIEIANRIADCISKDEQKLEQQLQKEQEILKQQNMSSEQLNSALERVRRELVRKQYSYGVITFYSAQVAEVKRALKAKLHGKYDELVKRQKLRVGSVDAFQGMEFDIIFLSIVRTGKLPKNFDIAKDAKLLAASETASEELKLKQNKVAAANYGFLTSPNRMCVAMSRQKKVLVVVGDSNIFIGEKYRDLAERFVPGMKHLYELSQKEGVVERVR